MRDKILKFAEIRQREVVFEIWQFLQMSGCCKDAEGILNEYLNKPPENPNSPYFKDWSEQKEDCPECGSENFIVLRIGECETRKTGRTYYKECQECDYWHETFDKKLQRQLIKRHNARR